MARLCAATICLLILFALFLNLRLLREALMSETASPDRISAYEKRFEAIKGMLPRGIEIGYLSSREAADIRFDPGTAEFYLTQYALAPLLIVPSAERELVIGNFASPPSAELIASKGLVTVRDFGNGVMLFRRKAN